MILSPSIPQEPLCWQNRSLAERLGELIRAVWPCRQGQARRIPTFGAVSWRLRLHFLGSGVRNIPFDDLITAIRSLSGARYNRVENASNATDQNLLKDGTHEMSDFEIHLPAIRGIQAGRPFFIALCPAKFVSRLMPLDVPGDPEETPFRRAADRGRSQEIARYLASNPQTYVLPTITCLVDREVNFDEPDAEGKPSGLGVLRVPLNSRHPRSSTA